MEAQKYGRLGFRISIPSANCTTGFTRVHNSLRRGPAAVEYFMEDDFSLCDIQIYCKGVEWTNNISIHSFSWSLESEMVKILLHFVRQLWIEWVKLEVELF